MLKSMFNMKPLKIASPKLKPPSYLSHITVTLSMPNSRYYHSTAISYKRFPACHSIHSSSSKSTSHGEIHVVVGPMFAGKTTNLLRRIQSEIDSGRNAAVIKSDKDNRYGLDFAVTHDGLKLPCWSISNLSSFSKVIGKEAYDQLDVIGIDEAQFFGDLYDFCLKVADNDRKRVIVSGLDGDYRRRSFGSVLDIVPLADSVTKLSARCGLCGNDAYFTLRKTQETETELIGGDDIYMPVCRQHYISGQVAMKAARMVTESQEFHTLKRR